MNTTHRPGNLLSLQETLAQLLIMKKDVQLVADIISIEKKKTYTAEVSFNRQRMPIINDKLDWLCDTSYIPPQGQVSSVPLRCFSLPTPTPIFTSRTSTLAEQPKQEKIEEGTADKYGWIKLDNGQYSSVHSKETATKNPFEF